MRRYTIGGGASFISLRPWKIKRLEKESKNGELSNNNMGVIFFEIYNKKAAYGHKISKLISNIWVQN